MKTIEVDEELYRHIASHTRHIGESASDILRRMLKLTPELAAHAVPGVVADEKAVGYRVRVLHELLLSERYLTQQKAVNRFMLLLATLCTMEAMEFAAATQSLHGRTRTYFASDPQMLLNAGAHTKPRQITGTPYWVITNTNTDRKRTMVHHIMSAMRFPADMTEKVCATL